MYPKQFLPPRPDDDDDIDDDWLFDLPSRDRQAIDDDDGPGQPHDPLAPLRPTHVRVRGQRARHH